MAVPARFRVKSVFGVFHVLIGIISVKIAIIPGSHVLLGVSTPLQVEIFFVVSCCYMIITGSHVQ